MIVRLIISALVLACGDMCAQSTPQAATQPDPKAAEQAFQNLPWAVKLGIRSLQVSQAFPLIDRVVLVPDAVTYLDELSKWSPQGRWPVLIEDDRLTPMFVRRFKPAQVIRRESAGGALPADSNAREKLMESIVVRTFGGDPAHQSIRELFAAQKYAPPGIVISSVDDPAWTAAVALAAGHGQPIAWLDGNFGGPNDAMDDAPARKLIESIDALIGLQRFPFDKLGDDIDAITICRSMACKANVKLPPMAQPTVPAPHNVGPIALTDLIGRHSDFNRYACTGWIFGNEKRSAYMAMCSLFLPHDQAVMCNTYPTTGGWEAYGMTGAVRTLERGGFTVREMADAQANEESWRRLLSGGVATDLFVMNTKGNDDYFDLSSGRGLAYDVPVLNQPVALHLIHSWSMKEPANLSTVGGRWLDHGAYAAVGSCHEPMLTAFVPPASLANRYVNLVPFLIAARWWEGEPGINRPWRVITIGDPLMVCPPPSQVVFKRIAKPAEYGMDLGEQAKTLMRQAPEDESGQNFAQAIAILDLLGKDDVAVELWRIANGHQNAQAGARAALGPLFRMRDADEFLKAWDLAADHSEAQKDMLWHIMGPRIVSPTAAVDRESLTRLAGAIRQPSPQVDVEKLAPLMVRTIGNVSVRDMIDREIKKATSGSVKQALLELSNKY